MTEEMVGIGFFGVAIACLAAWVTHVATCFVTASWGFLIAGAIFAPVGVVHGVGIWLGWW